MPHPHHPHKPFRANDRYYNRPGFDSNNLTNMILMAGVIILALRE